jgi:hypothetical protein
VQKNNSACHHQGRLHYLLTCTAGTHVMSEQSSNVADDCLLAIGQHYISIVLRVHGPFPISSAFSPYKGSAFLVISNTFLQHIHSGTLLL